MDMDAAGQINVISAAELLAASGPHVCQLYPVAMLKRNAISMQDLCRFQEVHQRRVQA